MTANEDQTHRTRAATRVPLSSLDGVVTLIEERRRSEGSPPDARFSLSMRVSPPTPGGFRALDPAPPDLIMRVQQGGGIDGIVEDATIGRLTELLAEAAPWFDSLPDASTLLLEVRAAEGDAPVVRLRGTTRGGFLEATEVVPAALRDQLGGLAGG